MNIQLSRKSKPMIMRLFKLPLILALISLTATSFAFADADRVLLRIEDREITKSEFKEIYRKNNLESAVAEEKSIEEYLEMYIDFRLKVRYARDLGLDTLSSFVEELDGYRNQLAQKYLVDHDVTERLVEEAYERSQYDVRVSHILLNLEEHAPPKDTLEVYEQMMDIRQRVLDGESFGDLAEEYSDDPSARGSEATGNQPARRGNSGDLGYFTVFNMVYPFESAAYATEPGEVSMPFRTSFGYHILKVHDRLPAMGQARVAHIMLMTPETLPEDELEEKEQKIHELHAELLDENADFAELAEMHSEDQQSAGRGGEMPPFASNRMVPQFIKAISEMEEGQISEPVRTDFGWHIIKLLEKTPPPDFEDAYADLQNRIQRDGRSQLGQEVVIKRLKEEYDFNENKEALYDLYEVVDENIFSGQWEPDTAEEMNDVLFGFAGQEYTQSDFLTYIESNQRRQNPTGIPEVLHRYYEQMVDEKIIAYEDSRLEEKYPEFRQVMQEYHDGILLFEVTNEYVWSKATENPEELEAFFEENQDRYDAEELSEIRGTVIADYQNHLEEKWLETLHDTYDVWVDEELLQQIDVEK